MRSIVRSSLPLLVALGVSAPSALFAGSSLDQKLLNYGATGQQSIEQWTVAYGDNSPGLLDHKLYYLAQAGSEYKGDDELTEEDISNILIGMIVVLILPLFWRPTRKAVGLLNIIIGAIVSLTGVGIILGIPMILLGGICLFL